MKPERAAVLLHWLRGCFAGVCLLVLLGSQSSVTQQNSGPSRATALPGQTIFAAHCAQCHGDHGQGRSAVITILGPSLEAEHEPGRVMAAVETGPSHMPRFSYVLSVQDMHDVSNYVARNLAVIPLGGGDIGQGGKWFREECAPCHRTAVRGGALGFVGTNAPDLAGKSAALIAGAIRWGPGAMPKFPPAVLDDHQVASIVAYIQTIQKPASPGGNPLNWFGPVPEGLAAWVCVLFMLAVTMWIETGGRG